jgi:5-carboxymethyl-2-hydroxymuconate isomerase
MPHIVIESTPRLFVAIDFVTLFSAVHHRLAADGHAVLDDFKSRVHVRLAWLTGRSR